MNVLLLSSQKFTFKLKNKGPGKVPGPFICGGLLCLEIQVVDFAHAAAQVFQLFLNFTLNRRRALVQEP